MPKIGFYPTPDNESWIIARAHGRPTELLNAVLDAYRASIAQQDGLILALADIARAIREQEAQEARLEATLQAARVKAGLTRYLQDLENREVTQ